MNGEQTELTRDTSQNQVNLYIVDAKPEDYRDLASSASARGYAVHFATSGYEALRLWQSTKASLWMINVHLADMSGWELQELIRHRNVDVTVCIIGDEYRVEDEISARRAGVALYAGKPPCVSWLEQWRQPTDSNQQIPPSLRLR